MISFDDTRYTGNMEQVAERPFDYRKVNDQTGWSRWQQEFRQQIKKALGMERIAKTGANVPLNPELTAKEEHASYIQEKRYIFTEPGIRIPFYLLIPTKGKEPYPLVITPHGHGRRGKEVYVGNYESEEEEAESKEGDRDIAIQAVAEGYAVIAPDVRGFWEMAREQEIASRQNNSCEELQRKALMYGRTLIGERVHDVGKLIDYAQTRAEIDTSQIVITGNSGGGTVSLFAAALDERISLAVPGSYFCTFWDSIITLYHCPCNIVPGIMELGEMYDVAGLIAPRPVLMVNGADDPIYPLHGTRQAFDHLQRIYKARGAENNCELYVGDGGHRYYKDRVWGFVSEKLNDSYK